MESEKPEQLVVMSAAQAAELLKAQGGTLTAVVEVVRKESGLSEQHTLVMSVTKEA